MIYTKGKAERLIAEVRRMLSNATYADGQGTILTQDAEAVESALAEFEPRTPEQYVHTHGTQCPVCLSQNLRSTGGGFLIHGGHATQGIECVGCGASWTDVYRLMGYNELELPE